LLARNATTDSKLDFRVYNEQATPRELIGQAAVELFAVIQKNRGKSKHL